MIKDSQIGSRQALVLTITKKSEDPSVQKVDFNIKKELRIVSPLKMDVKTVYSPLPNATLISVSVENVSANYAYVDNSLKEREEERLDKQGVAIVIEDIQSEIRDSYVKELDSEDIRSDIMAFLKASPKNLFEAELVHGVLYNNW